jgi:hypothetical protein
VEEINIGEHGEAIAISRCFMSEGDDMRPVYIFQLGMAMEME